MPFTYNWAPNSYYFNNINVQPIPSSDLLVYVNSKDSSSYNGSGSTFFDLSGNGNNMTISNTTWDNVNKVFNFNGTNSYITTPNIYSQLTTGNAVVSQTQEVWFKSSNNGIIVDETNNLAQTGWHDSQIEIVSGQVKGRYWNMASPYLSLGSNITSQWNYACIRYNGSTNRIDGNLNGTFTSSQTFTREFAPSPAVIYYVLGGPSDITNMGSGSYFNGQMAIYRTYKRALTNTEITNNYNSQKGLFGL